MNKIILHVGTPKTGTSFIQSSLEKSSSNLAKLGIHYPTGKSTLPTSDAKLRTGNTNRKNIFHLCEKFVNEVKAPQECLLLSHEMLFSMFANDEKYFRFFNNLDIQVIVVLMIRNPIELVASTYGQEVKRGGYAKDFEFYVTQFRMFDELFQFFESAEKYGVSVNFTNYSNAKNSLLNAFSELIGIPKNTLITPDAEVINRSLSDAETYIQKKFNEKYGREAHKFISDPLCEKLIHIKSGKPRLSEKSFLSFKEKKNAKIAAFNTKHAVSGSQKLDLICEDDYFKLFSTEPDEDNISISYAQLDLLIESLDKELTNPFRSLKRYVKQNLKIGFPKE